MRAYAAARFEVNRFGVWRAAVYLLASCGIGVLSGWAALQTGWHPAVALGLASAGIALIVGIGWSVTSRLRCVLCWDGQRWLLDAAAGAGVAPTPGRLSVAMDLGNWMLLRFDAVPAAPSSGRRWIPVQRMGLESQWHALRCALRSPNPHPGAPGAALI